MFFTGAAIGSLIGPAAAGFVFDASGSYLIPITGGVLANLLAAGVTVTCLRGTAG